MPDVQEHAKEGPRSHSYKRDEGYILMTSLRSFRQRR